MVSGYTISEGSQTREANAHWNGYSSIDEDYEEDYEEDLDRIPVCFDKNDEYYTSFSEHLRRAVKEKGVTDDVAQKKFLCGLLQKTALYPGEKMVSEVTVRNWLTKGRRPSDNQKGRNTVFRLCFALGFDDRQTADFFIKAYWTRPFNFRRMPECVYWFCLKNRLSYQDAVRILDEVKSAPQNDAGLSIEEATTKIKSDIYDCQTKSDLISYLAAHWASFEQDNITARKTLQRLLDDCFAAANDLRKMRCKLHMFQPNTISDAYVEKDAKDDVKDITSDEQLLQEMYGFHARKQESGKPVYEGYVFQFPEYVAKNFPQFTQLQAIRNPRKDMSDDAVRKALILLEFYSFFARLQRTLLDRKLKARFGKPEEHNDEAGDILDSKEAKIHIEEYIIEARDILNRCGFGPLYIRNPYDWIFLHCAKTLEQGIDPLQELQAFTMDFWQKKD